MVGHTQRNCDHCGTLYMADNRNLRRGWGLCCSKSCAAILREQAKPGYDSVRVARNNVRRVEWTHGTWDVKTRQRVDGYTSEGYYILDGVAYDEYDDPVYLVTGEDDPSDSMYWDSKDF